MYPSVCERCARTPSDPLLDERVQALGLQVVWLALEEQAWVRARARTVEALGLVKVGQFVVPEREIVQALAPPRRVGAVDV